MAGVEADFPQLVEALWRYYSFGRALRALKNLQCSGSPCKEDSHYCLCWIEHAGEGAPHEVGPSGVEPGSVGAADGEWGLEGWGCSHSVSPRSSGASEERRGVVLDHHSPPVASSARTMLPTAAKPAAPGERERDAEH